jgi:hypothetical protein
VNFFLYLFHKKLLDFDKVFCTCLFFNAIVTCFFRTEAFPFPLPEQWKYISLERTEKPAFQKAETERSQTAFSDDHHYGINQSPAATI